MTRLLAAAALVLLVALPSAGRADLADAVALYDAGRHEEAFQAFVALAAEDDGQAMLYIARMYEAGEGIHQSRPTALTWYRRAAAHDVPEASWRLGQMLETGVGLPRDEAGAVRAYEEAASLGHTPSMVRLAALYADGSGALPDASAAARLLKRAVDLGDSEAAAALDRLVAGGTVPAGVLEELGVPPPPPPTLPSVEDLAAAELGAGAEVSGDAGSEIGNASTAADAASGSVAAMPADSEAAARLRASIETTLGGLHFSEGAGLDYVLDVAEASDGTLTATAHDLALVGDDFRWEIGDVVWRLAPRADGDYDAAVELPAATTIYDATGSDVGGTTIGYQRYNGVVLASMTMWKVVDVELREIAAEIRSSHDDRFGFSIGRVTAEGRLDEQEPGKWGGPMAMTMEDVRFLAGPANEVGSIDIMRVEGRQRGFDMVFFQAFGMAQAEAERRLQAKPLSDSETAAVVQELMTPLVALARERAPLLGDAVLLTTIEGISGVDAESGTPFSIGRLSLEMAAEDFDTPAGALRLAYEHSGFELPVDGAAQRYLPGDVAVRVALRDLPVEDAATMSLELMESGLADPAAFEDNMAMAMGFVALGLQQSMATAGSRLDIEEVSWRSETLSAGMEGSIVASTSSPQGAVGVVTLTVEGLEAAVAELSAQTDDPEAQEMAMPLAMMQAMGARTEEGGVVRHVYALELTEDGRTLLNGNDMGPMLDGMTGDGTMAP